MKHTATTTSAARAAGQKKSNLIYVIRKSGDRQFQHLEIEIMEPEEWSTSGKSALLSVKWQADAEDWSRWYAAKAQCATDYKALDIGAVMRRAAKVASKLFHSGIESPSELLAALAALGIERAEYDSRVSKYQTAGTVADLNLKRYMNDYTKDGSEGCTVAVLAADVAAAVPIMVKAYAEHICGSWSVQHYTERFAAWMAAGQPVKLDVYATAPRFAPVAEMLNQSTETGTEPPPARA